MDILPSLQLYTMQTPAYQFWSTVHPRDTAYHHHRAAIFLCAATAVYATSPTFLAMGTVYTPGWTRVQGQKKSIAIHVNSADCTVQAVDDQMVEAVTCSRCLEPQGVTFGSVAARTQS